MHLRSSSLASSTSDENRIAIVPGTCCLDNELAAARVPISPSSPVGGHTCGSGVLDASVVTSAALQSDDTTIEATQSMNTKAARANELATRQAPAAGQMRMASLDNTWALVLAAGQGSRLSALTTTLSGAHVPKQFCSLLAGPSLVQDALSRARSVASDEQVCAIVAAQHHRWWECLSATNLIVQPENRGTANGILLSLLHIAERDPGAHVVLLPSDHHVQDEPVLTRSLRSAVRHVRLQPHEILLLGIEPAEADPELGYVVPGDQARGSTFEVARFIEKPPVARARELIENGALWNAFIVAASVDTLLRLLESRFPEVVAAMRDAVRVDLRSPRDGKATAALYEHMPILDFSRDVLCNRNVENLRVLPVPQCGWSDLGTPLRVTQTLKRLGGGRRVAEASVKMGAQISLAARIEGMQRAGLQL